MSRGDDARAVERDNLKLALAAFAMQLDIFEMRTNRKGARGNGFALRPPALDRKHPGKHQGENEGWSIRSLGSKPAA
jgi:hypothetical protein